MRISCARRPAAGGSPAAEAVKVLARTHKTLIWERSAVVLRPRAQLLEYFPTTMAARAGPGRAGAARQGAGPGPRRQADRVFIAQLVWRWLADGLWTGR